VVASGLFFSFDQEFDIDGQPAGVPQEAFDSFEQNVSLSLIVGGSAREQILAADGGFKWRRGPLIQGIGRLDVVVAVE
jgi:hypothetical protein